MQATSKTQNGVRFLSQFQLTNPNRVLLPKSVHFWMWRVLCAATMTRLRSWRSLSSKSTQCSGVTYHSVDSILKSSGASTPATLWRLTLLMVLASTPYKMTQAIRPLQRLTSQLMKIWHAPCSKVVKKCHSLRRPRYRALWVFSTFWVKMERISRWRV